MVGNPLIAIAVAAVALAEDSRNSLLDIPDFFSFFIWKILSVY